MHPRADLWFETLTGDLRPTADTLRGMILNAAPGITEEFKYSVPFYYYSGKPVCYLNRYRDGIDLGFWDGHRLQDDFMEFEGRGKKMVRHLHFGSRQEALAKHVTPLLLQALELARERAGK